MNLSHCRHNFQSAKGYMRWQKTDQNPLHLLHVCYREQVTRDIIIRGIQKHQTLPKITNLIKQISTMGGTARGSDLSVKMQKSFTAAVQLWSEEIFLWRRLFSSLTNITDFITKNQTAPKKDQQRNKRTNKIKRNFKKDFDSVCR